MLGQVSNKMPSLLVLVILLAVSAIVGLQERVSAAQCNCLCQGFPFQCGRGATSAPVYDCDIVVPAGTDCGTLTCRGGDVVSSCSYTY